MLHFAWLNRLVVAVARRWVLCSRRQRLLVLAFAVFVACVVSGLWVAASTHITPSLPCTDSYIHFKFWVRNCAMESRCDLRKTTPKSHYYLLQILTPDRVASTRAHARCTYFFSMRMVPGGADGLRMGQYYLLSREVIVADEQWSAASRWSIIMVRSLVGSYSEHRPIVQLSISIIQIYHVGCIPNLQLSLWDTDPRFNSVLQHSYIFF